MVERAPAGETTEPRQVGSYAIEGVLGRGGMGVVYRAFDTRVRRSVALKMIVDATFAKPEDLERFEREAQSAGKVSHPGIVQVYEAGVHDGKPYIAMELVEGRSFEALLRSGEAVTPRRVAEIVLGVAEALHAAHERGIVHRDVKPQNVLLDTQGRPRLADFGLARDTAATTRITQTGAILGTPGYLAPEQAQGDPGAQGPLIDVHALGAVLYRALVGRPPFEGPNVNVILMKVCREDPTPPRELRPQLHADLETIALRCLEKEPGRRYASARAVADDLRRFLDGEAILGRPVGRLERLARRARRHWLVFAPVALVLVAGLIATPFVLAHFRDQRLAAEAEARRKAEVDVWRRSFAVASRTLDEATLELDATFEDRSLENRESLTRAVAAANACAQLEAPKLDEADAASHARLRDRARVLVVRVAEKARTSDTFLVESQALLAAKALRPSADVEARLAKIAPVAAGPVNRSFYHAMNTAEDALYQNALDDATDYARAAMEANPLAAAPWLLLAKVSLRRKELTRAFSEVEKAFALAPGQMRCYESRAVVHRAREDWEAALADYRAALAAAPGAINYHFDCADLFLHLGRADEAIDELDRMESSPRFPALEKATGRRDRARLRLARGMAYGMKHDFARADALLTKALELDPAYRIPLYWRGLVRGQSGDLAAGIADLETYLATGEATEVDFMENARVQLARYKEARR